MEFKAYHYAGSGETPVIPVLIFAGNSPAAFQSADADLFTRFDSYPLSRHENINDLLESYGQDVNAAIPLLATGNAVTELTGVWFVDPHGFPVSYNSAEYGRQYFCPYCGAEITWYESGRDCTHWTCNCK